MSIFMHIFMLGLWPMFSSDWTKIFSKEEKDEVGMRKETAAAEEETHNKILNNLKKGRFLYLIDI